MQYYILAHFSCHTLSWFIALVLYLSLHLLSIHDVLHHSDICQRHAY